MASRKQMEMFVKKDRVFKHKNLTGLFKILVNLCNLLRTEQYLDHCYCNLTYRQCWLCNLAIFVIGNKILDDVLRNEGSRKVLFEIAYRLLFYVKRIRNDGLDGEDRK